MLKSVTLKPKRFTIVRMGVKDRSEKDYILGTTAAEITETFDAHMVLFQPNPRGEFNVQFFGVTDDYDGQLFLMKVVSSVISCDNGVPIE